MFPIAISRVRDLVDGELTGQVNLSAEVLGCAIDSREVQQGDAFFAMPGAHVHGADYGAQALRDGARVVVVDRSIADTLAYPHLSVPDVNVALAEVAANNRNLSDALVIGITGSVGKTTTRSMLAAVLRSVYPGVESPRSFNNHLGVPLTLLQLNEGDEFAAVEIGASVPGETAALAEITRPEFGIVTRVAPAHLKGFQSLQGVREEKQQLIRSLPADGVAFLNADDRLVAEMAQVAGCRVVRFGSTKECDVQATEIHSVATGIELTVDGTSIFVPVHGRHNATAALAAVAVGLEVGLSLDDISDALATFRPMPGRCEVLAVGQWTIIDDTYNSSPASVAAAISVTEDFDANRHRLLVLGDMLDLGEQAQDLHFGIGAAIAPRNIDHVLVTGEFGNDVVDGFLSAGGSLNRISVFRDQMHLASMLDCLASDGDVILVKGSRATSMERIVQQLYQLSGTPSESVRGAA